MQWVSFFAKIDPLEAAEETLNYYLASTTFLLAKRAKTELLINEKNPLILEKYKYKNSRKAGGDETRIVK